MAETPEESDYTAIQQRILERDPQIAGGKRRRSSSERERTRTPTPRYFATDACTDLACHFCEDVADALRRDDPALAAHLYQLAETSIAREGSVATGAGEGLQAEQDLASGP